MKRIIGFSILCASLFFTDLVYSVDIQSFPGVMCRYYSYIGNDTYFDPSGYSASGLKNTSTSSKYVSCPVPKNWADDTLNAGVIMSSSSGSCKLYRRSMTTDYGSYWSTTSIDDVGDLYQYEFSWYGAYKETGGYSLAIYCSVPSTAYVANYFHSCGY